MRSSCCRGHTRSGLVLAAVLAGCTPAPDSFRDRATPITSTTRFDASRFAGTWQRTAAFAPAFLPPTCAEATFALRDTRMRVAPCGGGAEEGAAALPHEIDPLGRLTPAMGPPIWVLWVDEGFRTAVVGTPDGAFGWVLERQGATPPDRMAAAREVLDFNGYDIARLIVP